MPDTILKRWNGSAFEELYPKTTVGQISASGTADITTVLRGNGTWGLASGHSHGNIDLNGAISSATVTPANDDRILIADASGATFGKIERGIIIGTSTTTFLANDGQWRTPAGAGSYTLPTAAANTLGGIETGFTSTETNRAVILSGNDAYVTLPRQIPTGSTYSAATLYVKRIWSKSIASNSGFILRYDAGTGAGTTISTTSTFTNIAIGYTPTSTDTFMIEFSNSTSNSLEKGIALIGYGTFSSSVGMAVISYDAYDALSGTQLTIAKYFMQVYGTSTNLGFRYGSKLVW